MYLRVNGETQMPPLSFFHLLSLASFLLIYTLQLGRGRWLVCAAYLALVYDLVLIY